MAVGSWVDSQGAAHALTEKWNGTAWSIIATPAGSAGTLTAVACPSTSDCVAVGFFTDGVGPFPLAERWNGSSWSVLTTNAYDYSTFNGVACPASSDCHAVGTTASDGSAAQTAPLAERWTGGQQWSIDAQPAVPAGWQSAGLASVACPTTSRCVAVGAFAATGAVTAPFASTWSGGSWVFAQPPAPYGPDGSVLNAVDCLATECDAVGFAQTASQQGQPVTERLSGGVWSLTPHAVPTRSQESFLLGVSCPNTCVAAGYIWDMPLSDRSLVEVD
jgi:hypothetical protein